MKKIITIILLALGLESFGQGQPFAPYKDATPYTSKEASLIVAKDLVLAKAYTENLQKVAEQDGWISFISGGKIPLGNTIHFLQNLTDTMVSWNSGDVSIGERIGNKISYFYRNSLSDRKKKISGLEPVATLDVTKVTGWKDKNGNPFPVRIIMARRCVNAILDLRIVIAPIQPQEKKGETVKSGTDIPKIKTKNNQNKGYGGLYYNGLCNYGFSNNPPRKPRCRCN